MFINEAIRAKDFSRAVQVVTKYLRGKLGNKIYVFPTPEIFTSSTGRRIGVRYFISSGGNKSIRLNWKSVDKIGAAGLESVDYWDGQKTPQPIPTQHYKFDTEQSLVKVLPMLVDIIKGEIGSESGFYINESTSLVHIPMITDFTAVSKLNEARYDSGEISKTLRRIIDALKHGMAKNDQYKAGGSKEYGAGWNKLNDVILSKYPNLLKKSGNKNVVDTDVAGKIDMNAILSAMSDDSEVIPYRASAGSREEIEIDGAEEEDVERITYEEQIQNLQTGIKLLMAGATQAVIVQGAGGVGKTQTVEDTLASMGKTDGEGFFKISGSISPSGLYRVLFEHRDELILSDDCDDLFKDQEGRNLLKAACDTKKVRKISWMKSGGMYVDPDDYDYDNPGNELPKYFDFKGKLIAISNLKLDKLDPDGAFRTRCYIIDINPTNEELYAWMEKIAPLVKLDVQYSLSLADRLKCIEILKTRKLGNKLTSLRSFVRAINTMAGVLQQGGTEAEYTKFIKTYA